MIGWDYLTDDEKSRTYNVGVKDFTTAGGTISTNTAVMCNVPFLGKRQCRVMIGCPPAISTKNDIDNHGVIFSYNRENGPMIALITITMHSVGGARDRIFNLNN